MGEGIALTGLVALPLIGVGICAMGGTWSTSTSPGRPLIEAGLSEEDARGLDEKFGEWGPYDEREGEFVRYWSRYPELYETVLVMGESMVPER
ncbi:TPA: hypothetical protein EYP44_00290 [Candidatus Bathyarchaeota archaeon]|nr:hypothetical protein [Candidatus Bathyarchaeota archaeon]